MTAQSDKLIALGAEMWNSGKCERGAVWGRARLPYCDRRARWSWRGGLYCAGCAKEHIR